ncbi:MAG: hypothetical protein LKE41_05660 [Prevotella sp.]|nr:hypothetical protein [Prevotella sp.]MCI2081031.1 hypothetical protein [Prevotella sp.]MCI2102930.1 hypothetical protein [Prevotella sp.]
MRNREYICPAISLHPIDGAEIMAGSDGPKKTEEQGDGSHFSKESLWGMEENEPRSSSEKG